MQKLKSLFSFGEFSENSVFAVKPGAGYEGDEELRAVSIWSCISHREQEGYIVLEKEVLIWEGSSIDGFASSAVVVGEISSLCHEIGDDAVEVRVFVSEAFFMCTEGAEVGCCFRYLFIEELEDKFTCFGVA